MKRTKHHNDLCPVAHSLDTVGDWWSLLIVRDAFLGKRRFGEFLESLGVARNILTDRLKKLVHDHVLEMVPASDGSAYHDYVLTPRGKGLFLVLVALRQWGSCPESGGHSDGLVLVEKKSRRPVTLELRMENGRKVNLDDVEFANQLS